MSQLIDHMLQIVWFTAFNATPSDINQLETKDVFAWHALFEYSIITVETNSLEFIDLLKKMHTV